MLTKIKAMYSMYTEREFFILIRGFFSFLVLDESKGVE